jgi:outer membrane protein assembly factor BamB
MVVLAIFAKAEQLIFQNNLQRTGLNTTHFQSVSFNLIFRTDKINSGFHTASKSSPLIDKSGIYVGSDQGFFYKFDFRGKQVWRHETANKKYGIHATGAIAGDNIYFGDYDGYFYSLNKFSGKINWKKKLGDAIGSSAAVFEKYIYLSIETHHPARGQVFCIDKENGQVIWQSRKLGGHAHSSVSFSLDHEHVYVGDNSGQLSAFDRKSGVDLWVTKLNGAIKSTPSVVEDKIYVTTWGKALYKINSKNGQVVSKLLLKSKSQSTPTYDPQNKSLVFGSFSPDWLYSVDVKSLKVRWQKNFFKAKFIASGITLLPGNNKGSRVLISCDHRSLCEYDAKTGEEFKSIELASRITGSPAVFEDKTCVTENSGALVCFGDKN